MLSAERYLSSRRRAVSSCSPSTQSRIVRIPPGSAFFVLYEQAIHYYCVRELLVLLLQSAADQAKYKYSAAEEEAKQASCYWVQDTTTSPRRERARLAGMTCMLPLFVRGRVRRGVVRHKKRSAFASTSAGICSCLRCDEHTAVCM